MNFRCALTRKGVRYWEVVPEIFQVCADATYSPCPFAGGEYQWMRNLVLARELSRTTGLTAGFCVVFADHPALPFLKHLQSHAWSRLNEMLIPATVPFSWFSYQDLMQRAIRDLKTAGSDTSSWERLRDWVVAKIERAGCRRG
jgi:hypothetical protein